MNCNCNSHFNSLAFILTYKIGSITHFSPGNEIQAAVLYPWVIAGDTFPQKWNLMQNCEYMPICQYMECQYIEGWLYTLAPLAMYILMLIPRII